MGTSESGSPNQSPSPKQRRVVPAELKRDPSVWAGFQDKTGLGILPPPLPPVSCLLGEGRRGAASLGPERREYTFSSPLAEGSVREDSRG